VRRAAGFSSVGGRKINMKATIEHVALWTTDLERSKQFYAKYFGADAGREYANPSKGFRSVFLSFEGGARIEVMQTSKLSPVVLEPGAQRMGLTHIAISVGSVEQVDELTRRLKEDGFAILDGPRRTGDGYYESVALDPDGNRVEITA
jgi:lactoylglutathione lyase